MSATDTPAPTLRPRPPDDREQQLRNRVTDVNEAAVTMEDAATRKLSEFPARGLSVESREVFKDFTSALSKANATSEGGQVKAFETASTDTLPEAARTRLLEELVEDTTADATDYLNTAEAALDILEARLSSEAVGTPATKREALARDEAAALLDRSDDPVALAVELAADPDPDLRAVVAGPWGRRYLRSLGVKDAATIHTNAIRPAAIRTAATHGQTPEAVAAATGWARLNDLRGAHAGTRSATDVRLRPFR